MKESPRPQIQNMFETLETAPKRKPKKKVKLLTKRIALIERVIEEKDDKVHPFKK